MKYADDMKYGDNDKEYNMEYAGCHGVQTVRGVRGSHGVHGCNGVYME